MGAGEVEQLVAVLGDKRQKALEALIDLRFKTDAFADDARLIAVNKDNFFSGDIHTKDVISVGTGFLCL